MPKYTKKVWGNLNRVYLYNKFFYLTSNQEKELGSNIPSVTLKNNRIYLYSGKSRLLFKIKNEVCGHKLGELVCTRKYRPAKYRKSKKKK